MGDLLKLRLMDPPPDFVTQQSGVGLHICISSKFPKDAADPWGPHFESHCLRLCCFPLNSAVTAQEDRLLRLLLDLYPLLLLFCRLFRNDHGKVVIFFSLQLPVK